MFEEILEFYKNNKCEHVVVTSDMAFIFDNICEEKKIDLTISVIADARSATFFAYGEAKLIQTPVILVVGNQYLANCYTGLTEAWFQKVPLIIVSLSESMNSIYFDYLTPCITRELTIADVGINNYKSDLDASVTAMGPTLINIVVEFPIRESNICGEILESLNETLDMDDLVIYYGEVLSDTKYNFNIVPVGEDSKYGIISKYSGYLVGRGKNCYLVAPLELFKYDTNILNNRYINNGFKVVFINNGCNLFNIKEWAKNNQIDCKIVDTLEPKVIGDFTSFDKPMILIANVDDKEG